MAGILFLRNFLTARRSDGTYHLLDIMAESNQFSKPPNFQIELAKELNRIAAKRTLLSWIRTSVSLLS